MDAAEQQKMMLAVDKKGEDLDAVTKAWIDANQATWEPWLKAAGS
jgi:glycine betaine/proline transport system substrate-binding protein